ncbi:MAG: Dna2/Cas4 domain-containing protein [Sulfurihydrogenibium sp.]
MQDFEDLKTNGLKVNYYYVCHRKLWFFDRKLTMEKNSEKVLLGEILHKESYKVLPKLYVIMFL